MSFFPTFVGQEFMGLNMSWKIGYLGYLSVILYVQDSFLYVEGSILYVDISTFASTR